MATGNSGSFTLSGSQNFAVKINWSETYNESANTHVVSITSAELISYNWYGFTYYPNGTLSINGSTVVTFNKTGKVIYLSASEIDSILTLQCDVSN